MSSYIFLLFLNFPSRFNLSTRTITTAVPAAEIKPDNKNHRKKIRSSLPVCQQMRINYQKSYQNCDRREKIFGNAQWLFPLFTSSPRPPVSLYRQVDKVVNKLFSYWTLG